MTRRIPRVPALAVLAAALVVVAALVFQAFRAAQDQRATADRALREYAGFAAWEFASGAKEEMWLAMTELLRPAEQLTPHAPGAPLPSPAILLGQYQRVAACACAVEIPARYFFRIDLGDSALTTVSADSTPARPSAGAGQALPDAPERQWLRDTIAGHAEGVFDRRWRVATVVGSVAGEQLTAAYTVVRDTGGRPVAAYGVVSESRPFMARVSARIDLATLLPPALTRDSGFGRGRTVSIVVRDEQGHVVYGTPWRYGQRYTAAAPLSTFVSGFTVEAGLPPAAAGALTLDGSADREPLLLALAVATLTLVGVGYRQLRREAALARLRGDFVASVSHELRTPLAQIRMFAELLRMGWVRSEQERTRSLEIIDQEAQRLSLLVDTVLSFDGSARGAGAPGAAAAAARTPAALGALAREVAEAFSPLARARGVTLALEADDAATAMVDRGAIRQVLINLLDNAVKYGPARQRVLVRVERAAGDAGDAPIVRLSVEDEGPGIPPGERHAIWEPFRRLERDAGSAVAGSGIGLSVVRRLVADHGGRVCVEGGAAGGARFVVVLPAAAPIGGRWSAANPDTADGTCLDRADEGFATHGAGGVLVAGAMDR